MTEKEIIIGSFVKNFVRKGKAERVLFELSQAKKRYKFADKLNHNWEEIFKPNLLFKVDKKYDFPEKIKELLHFDSLELCYVISNHNDYDDKFLSYGEAFENLYTYGFASLIINIDGDTFFLTTEQVNGSAPKFIGKSK